MVVPINYSKSKRCTIGRVEGGGGEGWGLGFWEDKKVKYSKIKLKKKKRNLPFPNCVGLPSRKDPGPMEGH